MSQNVNAYHSVGRRRSKLVRPFEYSTELEQLSLRSGFVNVGIQDVILSFFTNIKQGIYCGKMIDLQPIQVHPTIDAQTT